MADGWVILNLLKQHEISYNRYVSTTRCPHSHIVPKKPYVGYLNSLWGEFRQPAQGFLFR